jgi:F-type H+-transporting ATPase subunit a
VSRLLGNPKILAAAIALGVLFIAGLAGGALGSKFGGGFLGSPLAHIQLKAEPISANPVFGGFQITNTMVTTWMAIVLLGLVALVVARGIKDVPGRFQGFVEVILEFFLDLAERVAGPEKARRFFPLVMTIFLFIVTSNWMGILPGFGTIGRFEPADEIIEHHEEAAQDDGHELDLDTVTLSIFEGDGAIAVLPFGSVRDVTTAAEMDSDVGSGQRAGLLVPFFRSANTNINTPLAIALVAMFMVHWWGLRALGVFGHLGKYLNFREGPIGLFVGLLEGISEIARVISFTFRLFGNIFAGEVLLIVMAFLLPLVGLIPFLGLELFVGLIQAFIFAMLVLVFAATATVRHGAEEH